MEQAVFNAAKERLRKSQEVDEDSAEGPKGKGGIPGQGPVLLAVSAAAALGALLGVFASTLMERLL